MSFILSFSQVKILTESTIIDRPASQNFVEPYVYDTLNGVLFFFGTKTLFVYFFPWLTLLIFIGIIHFLKTKLRSSNLGEFYLA